MFTKADSINNHLNNSGKPLPVTIITGFLGSGKTTLLNHILSNQKGIRTAVLVNEFGEIGIDNELIIATENDMVELSNGCICCSINQDLVKAVGRLLQQRDRFDYLVVETTGLADPLPVALTFVGRDLSPYIRLDSIITLVDADNYSVDLFATEVAYNQIRYGDIILLNKTDLVDQLVLQELEDKVREIKTGARILRTVQANVPLSLILGSSLFQPEAVDHPQGRDASHHDTQPQDSHHHDHSLETHGFTSVSFKSDRPFDLLKLQNFLGHQLPTSAFRAKGILWLAEREPCYIFHLCGRRFTIDKTNWGDRDRQNQLVIIGQHLDHAQLQEMLTDCLTQ